MSKIKLVMINYNYDDEAYETMDSNENFITIDYKYKYPVIVGETNYFECDIEILNKIETRQIKNELRDMYNCEDIWVIKKHEIKDGSELITKLDTRYGRIKPNQKKGTK